MIWLLLNLLLHTGILAAIILGTWVVADTVDSPLLASLLAVPLGAVWGFFLRETWWPTGR